MNLNDEATAGEEFDRALSTGNPETIASVIMANAWPLANTRFDDLIAAVDALPAAVLERYPVLRLAHPMTPVLAQTTHPFRPLLYPDRAQGLAADELELLLVGQMNAFRLSGDVADAMMYARRLEDRIVAMSAESRSRIGGLLWFFHHQIGTTLLSAGETSAALQEFETARQLAAIAGREDGVRMALGRAALAHAFRGSLDEAERALRDLTGLPLPVRALRHGAVTSENAAAALIGVDHMSADLDDLVGRLDAYGSTDVSWPFDLLARARTLLARQRPEDALEAVHLARNSHPPQQGSLATDVMAAMSIKAFLAIGDIARAREVAVENSGAGILTKLASVRVALREARYDGAIQELPAITAIPSLGPAQRAESALLAGWLELANTGELDLETATRISRIATKRDSRRLLATLPRQLIDHVKAMLPAPAAAEFDAVTSGLANFDMRTWPALTAGERRVLNALPTHESVAALATAFHVSPNTVKTQLKSLYRKLGCSSREDAIMIGTRMHLLHASGVTPLRREGQADLDAG